MSEQEEKISRKNYTQRWVKFRILRAFFSPRYAVICKISKAEKSFVLRAGKSIRPVEAVSVRVFTGRRRGGVNRRVHFWHTFYIGGETSKFPDGIVIVSWKLFGLQLWLLFRVPIVTKRWKIEVVRQYGETDNILGRATCAQKKLARICQVRNKNEITRRFEIILINWNRYHRRANLKSFPEAETPERERELIRIMKEDKRVH